MIKIAHESPISIFPQVQSWTDYDYALVHLFEESPEYLELFKKALAGGREVILDNSIFELGSAFDMEKFADWTADFDRYSLIDSQGEETPFSHAEGEVLRLFLESPKRLISRAFMQERLGGAAGESFDRAMDVRISRLRTKLKEDPKNPQLIKTIYGAGYIFLGDVSWGR